jgi:hypothetical protein
MAVWLLPHCHTTFISLKNAIFWDVTATQHKIPEDSILHSQHGENLKFCIHFFIVSVNHVLTTHDNHQLHTLISNFQCGL